MTKGKRISNVNDIISSMTTYSELEILGSCLGFDNTIRRSILRREVPTDVDHSVQNLVAGLFTVADSTLAQARLYNAKYRLLLGITDIDDAYKNVLVSINTEIYRVLLRSYIENKEIARWS